MWVCGVGGWWAGGCVGVFHPGLGSIEQRDTRTCMHPPLPAASASTSGSGQNDLAGTAPQNEKAIR